MVGYSILINFFAVVAYLPVCSRTATPVVGIVMLVFPVSINLLIAAGKAPPFTYVILRIYIIIDQLPFAEVMGALFRFLSAAAFFPMLGSIIFPAAEAVFMGGSRPLSAAGAFKCSPVTPFSWAGNVFVGKLSDNDAASRPYFNCVIFASLRHQAAIKQMISLYCQIGTVNYCLAELQPKLVLILAAARGRVPLYHAFRALCPSYVLGHTCACRKHCRRQYSYHHA